MSNAAGIEIGRFQLKAGVNEQEMREAYAEMVTEYLSKQPSWRQQYLVKLQDGSFIDLAFANSQATAELICASWQGNRYCDNFLALIEPVSMEFGSVTNFADPSIT